MEIALRDSEERIRGILHTAVEGIITIDELGIMESVNPAACKLFGYAEGEMVGRNVSMLMPQPFRSEHDHYLANYRRTGQGRIIGIGREVVGQRKNGTVFPMDLSVGEVRLAGERLFTGIVRDITERKRLEKEVLEIADREQRRIGQDLHDDLCQRLAGIGLMSEALEHNLSTHQAPEAIVAGRIAEKVRDAIEQTRTLARGLSPLETDRADLISALAELAVNTTEIFGVHCHFQAEQPPAIADPAISTHLYRIAQEAVSNAIRHGMARDILIFLDSADTEAILSIRDNGAGFAKPPESASKSRHGGMGLRIMKYRAGMIGGILETGTAEGGGVIVTCRFRPATAS
ncbi:MAG TPA: PAS domain S-box protein [Chthoniobacteraceae bacterium]|nr:PAS domain S-box protein [Chthoniobacteraceae bacterium]